MKIISIIDTTISDYNLGNQIIMEAVNEIINTVFTNDFIFRLQYAEKYGKQSLGYIKKSNYTFFGGTNSLSSQMNKYKQMGFSLSDLMIVRQRLTLLGVGWWQYQDKPNLYTSFFLNRLLSKSTIHSVRDEYTRKKLEDIGIHNAVNTSCPTTWKLTKEHCESIPIKKGMNVITTLTDYNTSKSLDEKFINLLLDKYQFVYYWVQGVGDLEYIESLSLSDRDRIKLIYPKLVEYDKTCIEIDADYIGTRLHAGIRAIQHKKRSLILAIDNRAKEISKDINLNICERGNINSIIGFIENDYKTNINIPADNINKWLGQFK